VEQAVEQCAVCGQEAGDEAKRCPSCGRLFCASCAAADPDLEDAGCLDCRTARAEADRG
jgi:hypothetical protein